MAALDLLPVIVLIALLFLIWLSPDEETRAKNRQLDAVHAAEEAMRKRDEEEILELKSRMTKDEIAELNNRCNAIYNEHPPRPVNTLQIAKEIISERKDPPEGD